MSIHYTPEDYQTAPHALRDKVILVTGAGGGIGREAALIYAKYGASLVLVGRTRQKLERVYDEIISAGGKTPMIFATSFNTLSEGDCAALAARIDSEFGRLDGLLHNASILGERTPIENANAAVFDEVIQINVSVAFKLTKHLLPLLKKGENASIIFTSSSVGREGRAHWGAYGVSKFATEGLMQILADELANTSSVRVNSLNPGATRTPMRASAYPAENPATVSEAKDIMACYLYLMDTPSIGLTGLAFNAQR
ncbi:MAG: YciK family oxidoreductase [Gammaproteobacteria bacterium]|nr:MAG: YciK family oxidoreductase [Gammaproteobacteria bacterium]